jgi:hypothetical protein
VGLIALGRMDEVIDQFFQFESFIVYGSFDFLWAIVPAALGVKVNDKNEATFHCTQSPINSWE